MEIDEKGEQHLIKGREEHQGSAEWKREGKKIENEGGG
jgi:hypothetical protein